MHTLYHVYIMYIYISSILTGVYVCACMFTRSYHISLYTYIYMYDICHIAIFPSLYKASTAGPAIAEWSAPGNSGKAAGLPVDSKEDLLPPQRCGCLPQPSLKILPKK